MSAQSIEEVLAEEVVAIHGGALGVAPRNLDAQEKRKNINADQRGATDRNSAEVQPRDPFYRALNRLNRAALCCSGGGIRSATFCLGVIQALANYDVDQGVSRTKPFVAEHQGPPETKDHPLAVDASHPAGSEPATPKPADVERIDPKASALGRFHYLSTVSGGGYIGSWLSSWRHRSDFGSVIRDLTGRPNGPDIEPPALSWLRAYSNYLTPEIGVTSADSWAAVAITVRNLILNWLVIIPFVCLILFGLKLIATVSVWAAHTVDNPKIMIGVGVFGAALLICAQRFMNSRRPSRRAPGVNAGQWAFLGLDLAWAFASAIFLTIFWASRSFALNVTEWGKTIAGWLHLDAVMTGLGSDLKVKFILLSAILGLVVYAAGWIFAWPFQKGGKDFIGWAASGLVYGALAGLGAYLFWSFGSYPHTDGPYQPSLATICYLLLSVILGVPWMMMAQLMAEIVFVGLTSNGEDADADREWLGRAAGWLAAGAVVWAVLAFLVFAGGYLVDHAVQLEHQRLVKAGGIVGVVSGAVTAFLGGSGKSPALASSGDQSKTALACNIGLAIAGPVFVAILIIVLSAGLDMLLFGDALAARLQMITDAASAWAILSWLILGIVITGAVAWISSHTVNVNRFSLHALYRNRLTRCYLGASNEKRDPDRFSGFDFNDNLCVKDLWPPKSGGVVNSYSLFHVVNIALNVVSTKRLAWQERMAESFTVTPRHCGSAYLGFRPSSEYGGPKGGLSLGTAMAISGAAVSPNMGYHSSRSIALLLTLFNVRLGWWLGNPGKAGDATYKEEGPSFAARPLFAEAFGLTTDTNPYVYLSDGGHFENLGLYEMVRRRCRLVVLIDAGCDPDFAFEDLGNAVRKIYIDLGIRITFDGLGGLKNRPTAEALSRAVRDAAALATLRATEMVAGGGKSTAPGPTPYYAVGTIDYTDADRTNKAGDAHGEPIENGYILYIKPAYHGTETGAGIRSYATAHPDFPHESTTDQWFTESQFESYRSLGLDITNDILSREVVLRTHPTKFTLQDALRALKVQTPA